MSCAQFKALIAHGNYPKIQDYLDSEFGEGSQVRVDHAEADLGVHERPERARRTPDAEDIILQIRGSGATSCDGTESQLARARERRTARRRRTSRTLATPCNRWWT